MSHHAFLLEPPRTLADVLARGLLLPPGVNDDDEVMVMDREHRFAVFIASNRLVKIPVQGTDGKPRGPFKPPGVRILLNETEAK